MDLANRDSDCYNGFKIQNLGKQIHSTKDTKF